MLVMISILLTSCSMLTDRKDIKCTQRQVDGEMEQECTFHRDSSDTEASSPL